MSLTLKTKKNEVNMVPILGDLHIGARSGNELYHEYFDLFFEDFFKFCDNNQVSSIIQTGDMFDVRKFVNTWCLDFFKEKFISKIVERDITCYVIVGNHDIHFRETLKVNTPSLVLSEWKDNFVVIDKPSEHLIDGKYSFLLVPWMAKSNRDDCEEAIKMSDADYMCGHFEFNDFPMHIGSNAKSHHKHTGYRKFKTIFSGHYHTKSQKDNVVYTGTPYELTWIDSGDKKGFFVLDDDGYEFVENEHTLHEYVVYPERKNCHKKFIRAIADNVDDKKALESWKDDLIKSGPHDIKFNEKTVVIQNEETIDVKNIKSTEVLLKEAVDDLETSLDKDKLKAMILKCYTQVQGDQND